MNTSFSRLFTLLCVALLPFANTHAFVVGAVEAGSFPRADLFSQPLELDQGQHLVDFYFETEGDISWGWDMDFDYVGDISMLIIPGESGFQIGDDLAGNPGASTDDGYRQFGGFPLTDKTGRWLAFTALITINGPGGALELTANSNYTSGNLIDTVPITPGVLVRSSAAVPLPGAVFFYVGSLLLLFSKHIKMASLSKL